MDKNLEDKLGDIKPIKLNKAEKQVLWGKIEGRIEALQAKRAGRKTGVLGIWGRLLVGAMATLVVFASGSFATVSAANASGPGDRLFGVDLALERLQIALARGDRKTELRLRFAEERLAEVEEVLALTDLEKLLGVVAVSASEDDDDDDEDDEDSDEDSDEEEDEDEDGDSDDEDSDEDEDDDDSDEDEDSDEEEDEDEDDEDESDEDLSEEEERILYAQNVLEVALEKLEEARDELEEEGNDIGVAAIDGVIERLQVLAEDYIDELDRIRTKLEQSDDELSIGIMASSEDLKVKFNLEIDENDDNDFALNTYESDDKTSISLEDGGVDIDYKEKEGDFNSDKDGDRDGDDDDDNDDKKWGDDDHDKDGKGDDDNDDKNGHRNSHNRGRFGFDIDDIEICYDGETLIVSVISKYTYLWRGADLGPCEDEDDSDEDEDEEDVTAPEISDVEATTTSSTAEITWNTDESADSAVWYSTSSSVNVGSGSSESSADFVTGHSISIGGLTASTTYYYVVESVDSEGNSATSSEKSFTTL